MSSIRILLAPVALIALLTLLVASPGAAEPPDFAVEIAPGLSPRLTPGDVAQIVLSRLAGPQAIAPDEQGRPRLVPEVPGILKMECVPGDPWMGHARDDPEERIGPDVVWVVHAKGNFTSRRSGPDGPITKDSGFYVIDDETGEVIGRGSLSSMKPE